MIDTGIINMFYFYAGKAKPMVDFIEVTLNIPVEPGLLREAVEKAVHRYDDFGLTPVLDERGQVFLRKNTMPVAVYPDDGNYCDLGTEETGGYLFRVFYTKNTMRLEVSHVLTDGRGMDAFLKTILYYYLTLSGHAIDTEGMVLTDDVPRDATERIPLTDTIPEDFQLRGRYRAENVFVVPEDYVYLDSPFEKRVDITFPAHQLLAVTKEYGMTPAPLLMAWMNQVLRNLYDVGEQTIIASVPVDMREMNHSKALGNYCGSISIESQPQWATRSVEEQMKDLREKIKTQAVPDVLYEKLAELKQAEPMIRQTPIGSKEAYEALRQKAESGEARNTYTLTNVGRVRFPKAMEAFCTDCSMLGMYSEKGFVLGTYTFGDTGHIQLTQNFESMAIAKKLCEKAKEAGIDTQCHDLGLVRMDSMCTYRFKRLTEQ